MTPPRLKVASATFKVVDDRPRVPVVYRVTYYPPQLGDVYVIVQKFHRGVCRQWMSYRRRAKRTKPSEEAARGFVRKFQKETRP